MCIFQPGVYLIKIIKLSVPPYMDLFNIGCTIEPPVVWYIQKCMLIWKICFYFSFVFAICLSKKDAPCYARSIH